MSWWGWAIGVAVAASLTTNPVLLLTLILVVVFVVISRRTDSPWARAFKLYLYLALFIVVMRVVFHVLVGFKFGEIALLRLPSVPLPEWAAGIQIGGTIYLEALLGAILTGLRLATLVIAVGAANALANPKRLLRSFPRALHEIGTAIVVGVSVAPQLAESVQRVMRARQLRGEGVQGIRAFPKVAIPVLQDTLDRSLLLAAAMETRGYGSRTGGRRPWWISAMTLGGLVVLCWGLYGLLSPERAPGILGVPTLVAGALTSLLGLWLAGRAVRVTSYRPDPWRWPETVTVLCGLGCAAAMAWSRHSVPAAMDLPLQPLAAPMLPLLALVGIVVAALPGIVTPLPPQTRAVVKPAVRTPDAEKVTP